MQHAQIQITEQKEEYENKYSVDVKQQELLSDESLQQQTTSVAEKIEQSIPLVTKKDAKLVEPAAGNEPAAPQYIGMDRKFAGVMEGDSERMKAVRNALAKYYELPGNEIGNRLMAIEDVINACKSYSFMRFSLFRSKKGKDRLREVKALKAEAEKSRAVLAKQYRNTPEAEAEAAAEKKGA